MDAASLTSFRTQAQSALETLFPASITIGSDTITATVHGREFSMKLRGESNFAGGFIDDYNISFRFLRAAVTTIPAPESKLTYNGVQYRIVRVFNDPSDPAIHIRCSSVDK